MTSYSLEYEPIIEKCIGCDRVKTQSGWPSQVCNTFLYPASKWRLGNCPMASHLKKEPMKKEDFIDPLKKSKQSMKGRK